MREASGEDADPLERTPCGGPCVIRVCDSADLATPGALAAYLRDKGLTPLLGHATTRELDLAHRLRAGLRQATEEHDGTDTEPSGLAGGLARIAVAAHTMAVEGLWGRLKICSSDECGWACFDHSKNRSRQRTARRAEGS